MEISGSAGFTSRPAPRTRQQTPWPLLLTAAAVGPPGLRITRHLSKERIRILVSDKLALRLLTTVLGNAIICHTCELQAPAAARRTLRSAVAEGGKHCGAVPRKCSGFVFWRSKWQGTLYVPPRLQDASQRYL